MEHKVHSQQVSSSSSIQEIPPILWNTMFHYRVHNNPLSPLVTIQSHINPFHAFPSYFLQITFNIILSRTSRSSNRSGPSGSPTEILYACHVSSNPPSLISVGIINTHTCSSRKTRIARRSPYSPITHKRTSFSSNPRNTIILEKPAIPYPVTKCSACCGIWQFLHSTHRRTEQSNTHPRVSLPSDS